MQGIGIMEAGQATASCCLTVMMTGLAGATRGLGAEWPQHIHCKIWKWYPDGTVHRGYCLMHKVKFVGGIADGKEYELPSLSASIRIPKPIPKSWVRHQDSVLPIPLFSFDLYHYDRDSEAYVFEKNGCEVL